MYEYIERFKKLGFGLFCHFGLYSKLGRGEWALHTYRLDANEYNEQAKSFEVAEDWAKRLDMFLAFTGRDVLTDAGTVSKITAKVYAESEFEKYRVTQDKLYQSDFDKLVEKTKKEK